MISEYDARAMVKLLGETAAVDGGHAEKKRFLMNGLCQLIGANAWVWALGCQIEPGSPQIYVNYLHGGFDEEKYANLLKALENPVMAKVVAPFFQELADTGKHLTMLRQEIDPEGLALRDGVREFWTAADIGPLILSNVPLDENSMSCIAIYRSLNAEPFTEREKKMAHIILDEVPWLHMSGWPEDRGVSVPKLYPRQRIVLNLLLDGLGRKQIAANMKITENTVSGYTKDIYKHFKVNSHVELMHKFQSGSVSRKAEIQRAGFPQRR